MWRMLTKWTLIALTGNSNWDLFSKGSTTWALEKSIKIKTGTRVSHLLALME